MPVGDSCATVTSASWQMWVNQSIRLAAIEFLLPEAARCRWMNARTTTPAAPHHHGDFTLERFRAKICCRQVVHSEVNEEKRMLTCRNRVFLRGRPWNRFFWFRKTARDKKHAMV